MEFQQINKYLQGALSESELAELFKWIEATPENRKEFIDYKKLWALSAKGDENENQIWEFLIKGRLKKSRVFKIQWQIVKYAAIFLFLIGTGITVNYLAKGGKDKLVYLKNSSIMAPPGQMTNVELPDGTEVMLNSGSSICYDGNFLQGERTVRLSGEAYFNVFKDSKHPFVVQTSSLNLKVHGTSFNIEAYPEEKIINATLIEGSLGVMNKENEELILLVPGENAHFDAVTQKITVKNVNTEIYTSWREGLITFRNEKLKDIATKLERWYNVKIEIKNQKLGEQAYYCTIMKNKPIDQILEVFRLTSALKYKIVTNPTKPTLIYWY